MKSIVTTACLSVTLLSVSHCVNAATLVETEHGQEGVQQIWFEGSKMRMNTGQGSEYVLADYAKGEVLIINPEQKEVVSASEFARGSGDRDKGLNVRVKHTGNGPTIASYPTQKYDMIVNGRTCNTTLVSAKALKDTGLDSFLEAMANLDFNPMGSQFMNECDRAEISFAKRLKKLGLPLATIDRHGKMRDKVRRIVKNAKLPPGGFSKPSGYRQVSMQQKIQDAMGGMMPPGAAGQMDPQMQQQIQELMHQQGR